MSTKALKTKLTKKKNKGGIVARGKKPLGMCLVPPCLFKVPSTSQQEFARQIIVNCPSINSFS